MTDIELRLQVHYFLNERCSLSEIAEYLGVSIYNIRPYWAELLR